MERHRCPRDAGRRGGAVRGAGAPDAGGGCSGSRRIGWTGSRLWRA